MAAVAVDQRQLLIQEFLTSTSYQQLQLYDAALLKIQELGAQIRQLKDFLHAKNDPDVFIEPAAAQLIIDSICKKK